MPATATVVVVGLCSILNMSGADPNMVAPSVVCEAPMHDAFKHTAFIAFKSGEFTSPTAGLIQEVPGSSGSFQYVELAGDQISLGVDVSKVPDHSDPGLKQLARLPKFAKLKSPNYNRDHVPGRGRKPTNAVGSFMPLGEGALHADFFTKDDWVFRNIRNFNDVSISGKFAREIHYDFPLPQNFAIVLEPLTPPGSTRTLTAATATPGEIWVGSGPIDSIIKYIQRFEAPVSGGGTHFEMYYSQVLGPPKTYIPYPANFRPMRPRTAAEQLDVAALVRLATPDSGYCGPDGEP